MPSAECRIIPFVLQQGHPNHEQQACHYHLSFRAGAAGVGVAIIITWPFAEPFAFAVILAVVFYPLHNLVLRVTKQRRCLAATLSTLLVILLFGVPAFVITMLAANAALTAAHYLSRRSAEEGGFQQFALLLAARPVAFLGRCIDLSHDDLRAIIAANAQTSWRWWASAPPSSTTSRASPSTR